MSAENRRRTLLKLIDKHNLPTEVIAKETFKSIDTVYAWRSGKRSVPMNAIRLLEFYVARAPKG